MEKKKLYNEFNVSDFYLFLEELKKKEVVSDNHNVISYKTLLESLNKCLKSISNDVNDEILLKMLREKFKDIRGNEYFSKNLEGVGVSITYGKTSPILKTKQGLMVYSPDNFDSLKVSEVSTGKIENKIKLGLDESLMIDDTLKNCIKFKEQFKLTDSSCFKSMVICPNTGLCFETSIEPNTHSANVDIINIDKKIITYGEINEPYFEQSVTTERANVFYEMLLLNSDEFYKRITVKVDELPVPFQKVLSR